MDGTIIDASEGILQRLQVTFDRLGKPAPTRDDLIDWIGPPMLESFQRNAELTADEAHSAVEFYRSLHDLNDMGAGTRVYDGVVDLLGEVAAAGVPVIHVTWGFSHPHEGDGSIATARTAAELRDLLLTA